MRLFFAGLAVNLGNPKVIVFFLALLPTVVEIKTLTPLGFAELIVVVIAVASSVLSGYALAAARARRLFTTPRSLRLTATEAVASARSLPWQRRRRSQPRPARQQPPQAAPLQAPLLQAPLLQAGLLQAGRPAWLPRGGSAGPERRPGCCYLRLTRKHQQNRRIRSRHQLTLCSVARSRAFGRSLPSGSRARKCAAFRLAAACRIGPAHHAGAHCQRRHGRGR